MTNPRGQAALNAQRKWRAAHPEARTSGGTPEQKRARREQIKAINPCYLKEARAILEGSVCPAIFSRMWQDQPA